MSIKNRADVMNYGNHVNLSLSQATSQSGIAVLVYGEPAMKKVKPSTASVTARSEQRRCVAGTAIDYELAGDRSDAMNES